MFLALGLALCAISLGIGAIAAVVLYSQQVPHSGNDDRNPQEHQNDGHTGAMANGPGQNADGREATPDKKQRPVGPIWEWLNAREGAFTAISNVLLTIFTLALVAATIGLYLTGEKSAEAAKEAANVARWALVTTQRPWVSISGVGPGGPIVFSQEGARTSVLAEIKNVGVTSALDVSAEADFFVHTAARYDDAAELKAFCDHLRRKQDERVQKGDVLFPQESLPFDFGALFHKANIDDAVAAMKIPFFSATALICVDYRDPITDQRHTTGIAYTFLMRAAEGQLPKMLSPDKGDIPKDAFGLARLPFQSIAD